MMRAEAQFGNHANHEGSFPHPGPPQQGAYEGAYGGLLLLWAGRGGGGGREAAVRGVKTGARSASCHTLAPTS